MEPPPALPLDSKKYRQTKIVSIWENKRNILFAYVNIYYVFQPIDWYHISYFGQE